MKLGDSSPFESGAGELLTKRRKRYTDREALELVQRRGSGEARGRNIVHSALERLWFRCVATYVDPRFAQADLFVGLDSAPMILEDQGEYRSNHIQSFVMRQVSRLSQAKGRFQTLPESSDWRDQRASKVGDHLLAHWHAQLKMTDARRALSFWQVVCGTGGLYTRWDPYAGKTERVYRNPLDGDIPVQASNLDPQTRAMYEALDAYSDEPEGDLVLEAISPFQVLTPAQYDSLDTCPWMVIEHVRSMEWMWRHYPKAAKDLRPEDFGDYRIGSWWRRLAGIVTGHNATLIPGTPNFDEEAVVVREFWRPPSPMVEEGAYVVASQSQILENSPHPAHEFGVDIRFPVALARLQPVPGRLWGMGMVEHLIEPQREYNDSRGEAIKHRRILSHPQWLVQKGTNLTSTRANIGDLWEYSGQRPPMLQNPPALSQAHMVSKDDALNDMRLLASQTEVSQGQTIPGVRSGAAIRALQERDLETVGPAYEEHESCVQQTSTAMLRWSARRMSRKRAIRIYGQDESSDVQYFQGSDLRGSTTVVVSPGSMAPKSKAMIQENVLNMMQMGGMQVQDPDQARIIYDALEVPIPTGTFALHDRNKRRANIENDLFAAAASDPVTGAPPVWPDVQPHDDHQIHHVEHTAFMLTDTYENLPPEVKMAVQAHDLKHVQAIARLVMAQAQMAAQKPQQGSEPRETGVASPPKRTE